MIKEQNPFHNFAPQQYKKEQIVKETTHNRKGKILRVDIGGRSPYEPVYLIEFQGGIRDWFVQSNLE